MRTEIIYEDAQIIVARKPAGLATQSAKVGQMDMVSELRTYIKSRKRTNASKTDGAPYLGVIHRLDQPVEGLLLFAREKRAAAALTRQLGEGTLNKQYYAVICGQPPEKEGQLVDYLRKDNNGKAQVVTGQETNFPDAKKAILHYRTKAKIAANQGAGKTVPTQVPVFLVDIHIDTGRFHQIRAQMAHGGMPLLGDSKYGTKESLEMSQKLGVKNVALCAASLDFIHPASGSRLSFRIDPEAEIFGKTQDN